MASTRKLHPLTPVMLGTMTLGNQSDESHSHAQFDEFVKLGGIWIDTAEAYPVPPTLEKAGLTEEIIGRWIAKNPQLRSKIAIATKVAGPTPPGNALKQREKTLTGSMPAEHEAQDFTSAQINRALDASLKRLQTDYVDLYQLHWPTRPVPLWGTECFTEKMAKGEHEMRPPGAALSRDGVPFDDIVKCMGELINSGKILSWGLSNESAFGITRFCESAKRLGVPLPISVQNDFSLLDRRFDGQQAEAATYYGVKLLAYGPLCGGSLSGKYLDDSEATKRARTEWRHDKFPKFQPRYYAERSMTAIRKYAEVAKSNNITLVQLALGFCATRYYMGSVIIGANAIDQLRENYHAVMDGAKTMTKDVAMGINRVHEERPNPNVSYADMAVL